MLAWVADRNGAASRKTTQRGDGDGGEGRWPLSLDDEDERTTEREGRRGTMTTAVGGGIATVSASSRLDEAGGGIFLVVAA